MVYRRRRRGSGLVGWLEEEEEEEEEDDEIFTLHWRDVASIALTLLSLSLFDSAIRVRRPLLPSPFVRYREPNSPLFQTGATDRRRPPLFSERRRGKK